MVLKTVTGNTVLHCFETEDDIVTTIFSRNSEDTHLGENVKLQELEQKH